MATRLAAAFKAQPNATLTIPVSSAPGPVALGGSATEYRIWNAGSAAAFLEIGGSGVVASASTSLPLPPGAVEFFRPQVLSFGTSDVYLSAVTASGTTTLYSTPGEGV